MRKLSSKFEPAEESSELPVSLSVFFLNSLSFHSKCGLNIIMDASCTTARRKARFNEGMVFSRKPLANNEMFQVIKLIQIPC